MSQSDRPLNSKELKIILKSDKFKDITTGKENIINIIKTQIQKQEGTFADTTQDEKHRKVWYLDTKKFDLNHGNNFILRIREKLKNNEEEKVKGYDVVLKNRDDKRQKALTYDLSNPIKTPNFNYKKSEFKFEEDILTPFNSKFSASTKCEFEPEQKPKIEIWKDILDVFPNLDLVISPNESLLRVNGFIAKEFSYDLGTIIFKDGNKAKTEISLWYKSKEGDTNWSLGNTTPVIVEFDIGIDAKESSSDNGTTSDEFPSSLLEETETFYRTLQKEDIVDLCAKKTKTEFVYEYKKQ